VYSFDPAGLELHWNESVICQTARGREFGRVGRDEPRHPRAGADGAPEADRPSCGADDREQVRKKRVEAKRAMLLFASWRNGFQLPVKPLSAEMVFDQSRIVFSYGSEERLDTHELQSERGEAAQPQVEVRAVGPREGARLCGGGGLCGATKCCNRYPSHESPITLKMARSRSFR